MCWMGLMALLQIEVRLRALWDSSTTGNIFRSSHQQPGTKLSASLIYRMHFAQNSTYSAI
uniref:Secreted protein n=1 Tax=Ascaris lumbricoides TaxID=6252 RepID=A0A0M3HLV0_ASCLU